MKQPTKQQRWNDATAKLETATNALTSAVEEWEIARDTIVELKSGYEEWRDNLPENLASSPVGEKLQAIVDLNTDIELDISDAENLVSECGNIELPMGFGRD